MSPFKEIGYFAISSMGVVLATATTEATGSWRHDADKWGIAFAAAVLLYFVLRWVAKREAEAQKRRNGQEAREQAARDARDLASGQERAALLERANELTEKLIKQGEDHNRRMEGIIKDSNTAQSNVAQAITTLTRKFGRF